MIKIFQRTLFLFVLLTVLFMVSHVFQHLIPGYLPFENCPLCQVLAHAACPSGAAIVFRVFLICSISICFSPRFPRISYSFSSPAPPLA
jgi:hypothetical protein